MAKKSNKDSDALQAEVFERQARICKAFANSTRLRMLDLLGKRAWAASELQENLGISKANCLRLFRCNLGRPLFKLFSSGQVSYNLISLLSDPSLNLEFFITTSLP